MTGRRRVDQRGNHSVGQFRYILVDRLAAVFAGDSLEEIIFAVVRAVTELDRVNDCLAARVQTADAPQLVFVHCSSNTSSVGFLVSFANMGNGIGRKPASLDTPIAESNQRSPVKVSRPSAHPLFCVRRQPLFEDIAIHIG